MLTSQEKRELNYDKLSPDLKAKIDAAFGNPRISTAVALHIQKTALEDEMSEDPFTIRGSRKMIVDDEGMKEREKSTERQEVETAIKVAKWLIEITDELEELQKKLTESELKEVQLTVHSKKEKYGKSGQVAI